jgi:glutamate racemase
MNAHNDRPIALFDSGIGGLSVLRHVHALLPTEALIYLADSAHTPYGDKSEQFIIERSLAIGQFFIDQGAKAIVIACNSATAAAVSTMRQQFTIPIIGMEPGIKPAVNQSSSKRVGIMATAATVASEKFNLLAESHGKGVELSIQACPGLVEQVEAMALQSAETHQLLSKYLLPLKAQGIDTLALGCTHYPFLLPLIRQILGEEIAIIDTGPAVAAQLKRVLAQSDGLRQQAENGGLQFFATHHRAGLAEQMSQLWGGPIELRLVDGDQ